MSSLRIDIVSRRADYARFYQDVDTATVDYKEAIDLCKQYFIGNERTTCSAYFSLGNILLDQGKRDEAKSFF